MNAPTHRVTFTIVLDVESTTGIGQASLALAHGRAEGMAMRVLLCGDGGGKIDLVDGLPTLAAVPVTATAATTMPGTMTIRRLGAARTRKVKP